MLPTLRILFIEDNNDDTLLIEAHLRRAGYAAVIRRVETAAEMAAALAAGPWDLVLSDYSLPEFGSQAALQALHASGLDLPFIIVSGTIEEEQAVAALRAGAHDFVVKNRLARLVPAIERGLREAEDRRHRRQAEMALQASQARFQALIEHSPDAISLLGPDGRLQYVSPSTQRILGYTSEEVVGSNPADFVHPDDLQSVLALLADLFQESGKSVSTQYRFRHKDGTWRWLEASIKNLLAEPSVGAVVFNYRDVTERVQSQQALIQAHNLISRAEQIGDIGSWEWDIAADRVVWSDGLYNIHGRTRQAFTPSYAAYLDCVHPDDRERVKQIIDAAFLNHARMTYECRIVRPDGQVRVMSSRAEVMLNEQGQLVRQLGIDMDITERVRDREALAASEAQLRALFAAMTDVVLVMDSEGRHLQIAATNTTLLVKPPAELLGRTVHEIMPAVEADRILETIRRALREQKSIDFEYRLSFGDAPVWFDATVSPMGPDKVIWIARDVTARKQAETALLGSRAQLEVVLNSVGEAIIVIDSAGRIVRVNQEVENIWGYEPQSLIGGALTKLMPESYRERHTAGLQRYLQTGEARVIGRRLELEGLRRDGTVFPLELRIAETRIGEELLFTAAVRDITSRKQAQAEIQRQLSRQTAQSAIDQAIIGSLDLRVTLHVLLDQVITHLGVDAADVLLLDPHDQMLEFAAGRGFRTHAFEKVRQRLGEGRAGRVVLERRMVTSELPGDGPPAKRTGLLGQEAFTNYFGVPLVAKGQVLGALELFHRSPLQPGPEWLEFLEALAGQAAIAVYDAGLFDSLQRSNSELHLAYDATIEGWSRALDLRDKETEGHSQRVTEMTLRLASGMGMDDAQLEHVRRGALLHDIGKMGVPDAILLKPGPLTDEEWVIMRRHPVLAHDLLSSIKYLRPALDIPYCHHEKWDGSGYPRGLIGDAIPLAARMFAVVDVWDALRSERPYRPPWTAERAAQHIRDSAGSHLDPKVVEAFLSMILETPVLEL